MKKKNFTLLTLIMLLGGGSLRAQTTIGLQQVNDGTEVVVSGTTYKGTLAAATYTGATNLTVAEAHGDGCGINQSERKTTGSDGDYWATKCFRKTTKASTWESTTWVGYTVEVASGYKMSLSNLKATLWDANSSAIYAWRVVVENSSGTALYTSDTKSSSTSSIGTLDVASPTGLSNLKTGKYTVKLQLYQSGGNKYFTVPYLTADATVEEDASATYVVTTSAIPEAGGTVTPETGQQVEGTDVILTATPNVGYKFVKWTIDGTDYTTNPYTLTSISAAHTAVATFEALPKITFENGEGTGTAPSVDYAEAGTSYTIPLSYFLYKDGATLTGWSDGTNTYAPGATYSITGDVTFTAVFTDNTVALGDAAATVNWNFATKDGAPTISCEGSEIDYVQHTTINGTAIDVVMHINTKQDAGISGSKGKVNNTSGDNRAQVNGGTVFTIPALKNMVVTVTATNTGSASVSSVKFDGNDADSYSSGVLTYTYTGSASTINLIDQGNNLYPSGISVSYPLIPTVAPVAPTFPATTTVDGGSTVAITSEGVTTYYQWSNSAEAGLTTASEGWTEGTSATVPNEAGTKYLYAYASNGDDLNSAVVSQAFTITKTGTVYVTKTWDFTNWSEATVAGLQADATNWSKYEKTNNGGTDFGDNGRSNVNSLGKNTIKYGDTVIPETDGLKFTSGAYGMGLMFNFPSTSIGTYHGAQYIWLYNNNTKIVIPNVQEGATIEVGVESHKDSEARGITVSNSTQTEGEATATAYQVCKYTVTAAGEVTITPTKGLHIYYISVTDYPTAAVAITPANDMSTYVTTKALDFTGISGLTAYVATDASAGKVTLTEVGAVPAGTPLMLIGTANTEYTVPVAASAEAPATNMFKAGDGTTVFDGTTYDYILYTDGKFYQIGDGTVATTKAYLHCDSDPTAGATSRSLVISFAGDTTTGLDSIAMPAQDNGEVYNLNGQRVAQPSRGLYIVNGKKVMVK